MDGPGSGSTHHCEALLSGWISPRVLMDSSIFSGGFQPHLIDLLELLVWPSGMASECLLNASRGASVPVNIRDTEEGYQQLVKEWLRGGQNRGNCETNSFPSVVPGVRCTRTVDSGVNFGCTFRYLLVEYGDRLVMVLCQEGAAESAGLLVRTV